MKHLGTITLTSDRLILRRIYEKDALEIFNGFINQEEFLYYANKEKRTLKEEIDSLKGIDDKYLDPTYYNWLITLKEESIVIGSINGHFNKEDETILINYALDNRYTNNGYASEALKSVINYLLNEVKIKRIECGCVIKNKASKRVIEKNNMMFQGIIKNYIKLKDGYHDIYLYYLENNN